MGHKISSENVSIRPIRQSDITYVLEWSDDQKFCRTNGWKLNRSEVEIRKWWKLQVNNDSAVYIRQGIEFEKRLVGYVDVAFIGKDTVELGIAIGESELWGKGIGTEAIFHTIENTSRELGITTFIAETNEKNIRSRRMLEKIGFKEIEEHLGTHNPITQYKLTLAGES